MRNSFVALSHHFRLKVLNLSSNALTSLPELNPIDDLNKVQDLYLSQNSLQDSCLYIISGLHRLRILHLAYNEINHLPSAYVRCYPETLLHF